MADLTTGYTFSSGESNVNHTKLNAAVNDAVINPAFLTGKSAAGTIVAANDLLLIYSAADAAYRKATLNAAFFNHASLITSRAAIATPVKEDTLLILDADGGTPGYGKATLQVAIFENAELIENRTEETEPVGTDELLVRQADGSFKRVSRTNFLSYAWPEYFLFDNAALVAHTAPIGADGLLIWDSVAMATKQITLANLLTDHSAPAGGIADADTFTVYDDSASAVAKVALSDLKTAIRHVTKSAVTLAIPTNPGDDGNVAHTLASAPNVFRTTLICTDVGGDGGYAENDEIELDSVAAGDFARPFAIWCDATNINVIRTNKANLYAPHKTTGAYDNALTASKWQLKFYCALIT